MEGVGGCGYTVPDLLIAVHTLGQFQNVAVDFTLRCEFQTHALDFSLQALQICSNGNFHLVALHINHIVVTCKRILRFTSLRGCALGSGFGSGFGIAGGGSRGTGAGTAGAGSEAQRDTASQNRSQNFFVQPFHSKSSNLFVFRRGGNAAPLHR